MPDVQRKIPSPEIRELHTNRTISEEQAHQLSEAVRQNLKETWGRGWAKVPFQPDREPESKKKIEEIMRTKREK